MTGFLSLTVCQLVQYMKLSQAAMAPLYTCTAPNTVGPKALWTKVHADAHKHIETYSKLRLKSTGPAHETSGINDAAPETFL